jgi:phage baseplate assembly protein W
MSTVGYDNIRLGPTQTEGQKKRLIAGSRTYRGFSTISAEIQNTALYDLALIKQDLINHFHIRKGEKLENPNFGTIIWDMLYEPFTEQNKAYLVNDVTEIVNTDPRTKVLKVIVTQKDQAIQIEVQMMYLPYNIQETMQFKFDQKNGLI